MATSRINRLTYYFASSRFDSADGKETYLVTDFAFIIDPDLVLPRPVEGRDVIAESTFDPFGYGSYSESQWSIGLAVNKRTIYIKGEIPNASVVQSGLTIDQVTGRQKGFVKLNLETLNPKFGLADVVEIIMIKANTLAPWIYLGKVPGRAELTEELNRSIAGMGAVQPSYIPSQAMGVQYFVNFDTKNQFTDITGVPFVTFMILPIPSASVSTYDAFLSMDILDGDGSLGVRSLTTFKIISLGETASLGGATFSIFNIVRADAYRTINYKELEYNKKSYRPTMVIKEAEIALIFEKKKKFNELYGLFSGYLQSLFLNSYIDFSSTIIKIYSYDNATSEMFLAYSGSDVMKMSEAIGKIQSEYEGNTKNLRAVANFLKTMQFSKDSQGAVFFTDFDVEDVSAAAEVEYRNALNEIAILSMGYINIDGKNLELLKRVMKKTTVINYSSGYNPFGFDFLQSLSTSLGKILKETDLYTESNIDGVDLGVQCRAFSYGLPESFELNDADHDGKVTLVDRLYSLYSGFNPNAVSYLKDGFFASVDAEMRYWRKFCPMGQLYEFKGKVVDVQNGIDNSKLMKVRIIWYSDDGKEIPYDVTRDNFIYVYIEHGAKSNVSAYTPNETDVLTFKGRLFYPHYIRKTAINPTIMKLRDPGEMAAWFRIKKSTALDFITYSESLKDGEDHLPLVVIRTNMDATDEKGSVQVSMPGLIMGTTISDPQLYKINQVTEYVEDCVLVSGVKTYDVELKPNQDAQKIFETSGTPIVFQDLEFDLELSGEPLDSDFLIDVYYQPGEASELKPLATLDKFWTAIAGQNDKFTVKLKPYVTKRFVCKLVSDEALKNRLFNIDFPYAEGSMRYAFTWKDDLENQASLNNEWDFTVKKNNTLLLLNIDYTIDPTVGQIILTKPIDPEKDAVFIEFVNASGGQKTIKVGNSIYVKLVDGPANVTPPKITSVKINLGSNTSIERVDGNYSSTAQGENYYLICPTYGYATLGGNKSWYLQFDENGYAGAEAGTGSGAGNLRIIGNMISPVWYFDAFADPKKDLKRKLIRKGTNSSDYPLIDILYSNMVNAYGLPFLEMRSVGYTPPPADVLPKVEAVYSELMERFGIYYSVDNNLVQKYSYTKFMDRSVDEQYDHLERDLKKTIPVYSEMDIETKEVIAETSQDVVNFSTELGDKKLIGIEIETEPFGGPRIKSQSLELQGLEYEDSAGNLSSQFIPVLSDEFSGKAFYQMPFSNNTNAVLRVPDFKQDEIIRVGTIRRVNGQYGKYVEGFSPVVIENKYGEYFLLFVQNNGDNQIMGLLSRDSSLTWRRPAALNETEQLQADADDHYYDQPIPILTGYANPYVVYDDKSENMYVFVYNQNSTSIDVVCIPRSLFLKISRGKGEDEKTTDETNQGKTDENSENNIQSLSEIIADPEINSYEQVLQSGLKVVPVISGATSNFSACIAENGNVYLAGMLESGGLIIQYNQSFGDEKSGMTGWKEMGVNFLSEDSSLKKHLEEIDEDIVSLTLIYNDRMNILNMFLATEKSLILYRVPEILTQSKEQTDDGTDELKDAQAIVDQTMPIVVISNTPSDFAYVSEFIEEDFPPQIVTVKIIENGNMWLLYLDSQSSLKVGHSKTQGTTWTKVDYV